ncbi:rhamnogalacturonyl hydrolase YesR [Jejuia pallidilutea]|uniref:Rhamnogalacturonyl hydrolase YesR n=1 Tax=Jejuia pallidilutea TaxID=504487 RepID=A0A362X6Y7_9FLAO|nr:glycoside hydrolase family 88 protein [Jejuia pallidilutea]PQV51496.1 rhamnogalacturonyl hydrolase YesR [Jejuia pallidilutea]
MKSKTNIYIPLTFFLITFLNTFGQKVLDKKKIEIAMVKAMEWQEQHPIFESSPTDWTNGAYYTGVTRAHMATGNQLFLAALKNMGHNNDWQTSTRYFHADDLIISYPYLYLRNKLWKGLVDTKPTETFIQKHIFEPNKWRDGTDPDPVKKILWWWCDALFMAPPVLTVYAKQNDDIKYLDAMHTNYMQTYNLLYDKEAHLFARDTRFIRNNSDKDLKENNGEKIFWSRGNGWVIGGLALILEDMPKDYTRRAFYENLFIEMSQKIIEIQPKDGLWRTSLLSPETYNHGEVSGSGFFTFGLAWGINNGLLDKETYEPVVYKTWEAIEKCQHKNGMVGWVQNIGASPKPASYDSWQNFGTGAFLMAGSEILKIE